MCPGMEWAADSAVLRFHRSKGAAVKTSSSVFLCDLGLPWAHRAAKQSLFHQPCYGYDSTALTRLDVWCFRGDGMLTCQAQNAALTSQICWRTRPATDFQTLCTCVYKTKNLNLNTSKTWGFLGNIMIIIVIRYSTYRGIPTLWIWFFSQLSPKSAVPNSPRSEPHELGSKVCPTWLIEGKTPGWVLVSVFSIKTLREMDLKIRHLWSCFSGFLVE